MWRKLILATVCFVAGLCLLTASWRVGANAAEGAPGSDKPQQAGSSSSTTPQRESPAGGKLPRKDSPRKLFTGKVVLAQEALKKRGIKVAEEMKSQAVLETESGELIPIAADWRGRAFYQDKRLRDRKVELVGYRQPGIPYLQVLGVYFSNSRDEREVMDYWCDICSIPMYEIKDCECCQGPIRLRYRKASLPAYLSTPAGSDQAGAAKSTGKPAK